MLLNAPTCKYTIMKPGIMCNEVHERKHCYNSGKSKECATSISAGNTSKHLRSCWLGSMKRDCSTDLQGQRESGCRREPANGSPPVQQQVRSVEGAIGRSTAGIAWEDTITVSSTRRARPQRWRRRLSDMGNSRSIVLAITVQKRASASSSSPTAPRHLHIGSAVGAESAFLVFPCTKSRRCIVS